MFLHYTSLNRAFSVFTKFFFNFFNAPTLHAERSISLVGFESSNKRATVKRRYRRNIGEISTESNGMYTRIPPKPVPFGWYLFLEDRKSVPFAWYPFLESRKSVPFEWYLFLEAPKPVPFAWYPFLGARKSVPFGRYPFLEARKSVPFRWYLFLEDRKSVPFAWYPFMEVQKSVPLSGI
jgi:hypothetical protein